MKRFGVAVTAFLAAALLLGGTALASNEWCDDDPVFHTLGTTFSLTSVINASSSDITSVAYVVEVPANAEHVAVSYPTGRKLPTTVKIVRDQPAFSGDGSFSVVATVTVSGPSGASVQLFAGGDGSGASTVGTTGGPVTLTFSVSSEGHRGDDQGSDQN